MTKVSLEVPCAAYRCIPAKVCFGILYLQGIGHKHLKLEAVTSVAAIGLSSLKHARLGLGFPVQGCLQEDFT